MATLDRNRGGYRIFLGDLGSRIGKHEIEKEFNEFGQMVDVWVARNPPGFAFLVFKYPEDAEKAVRQLDGRTMFGRKIRVEHARPYGSRGGGGDRGRGSEPPLRRMFQEQRQLPYRRTRSRSRSPRRRRDRSGSNSRSRSPAYRRSDRQRNSTSD